MCVCVCVCVCLCEQLSKTNFSSQKLVVVHYAQYMVGSQKLGHLLQYMIKKNFQIKKINKKIEIKNSRFLWLKISGSL